MKIYEFQKQLEKQQAMFDRFVQWLKIRDNVIAVTMADDKEDRKGIDLWAIVKGESEAVPIQVKVDFHIGKTGNMAVETVGQMRWSGEWRAGWMSLLCNTQLLVYLDGHTGRHRIYNSQAFFDHIVTNYSKYRSFIAMNGSPHGGEYWYGIGVRVPTSDCAGIILDSGNINDQSPGELILAKSQSVKKGACV